MRTLFGFRRAGIAIACTSVAFACSDRSPTQPPNPSSILLVSGDQQQAVVANALNEPIVVRVLDEKNQVEAGVTVSFVAAEGAGTVHPQEAETDADGIARTIWIVGTSTRVDKTLQARVENRLGPALVTTFHAKALPGPATALAIGTEPTTATVSGAPLYVQPSVLLVDRYGNVVPLSGVRVSVMCHIESAADFHNAVAAGVDQTIHMPGFRGNEQGHMPSADRYIISDGDASAAARKRIVVVTTLQAGSASAAARGDTVERERFDSLHTVNLRSLARHNVTIAIGTDNYRATSVPEANYLQQLGVFSNVELLRMWTVATPRAIFPTRRIGRLDDGYEASFLGLEGNPLDDFSNTARIALRVKQGVILP